VELEKTAESSLREPAPFSDTITILHLHIPTTPTASDNQPNFVDSASYHLHFTDDTFQNFHYSLELHTISDHSTQNKYESETSISKTHELPRSSRSSRDHQNFNLIPTVPCLQLGRQMFPLDGLKLNLRFSALIRVGILISICTACASMSCLVR
jgi:hypothetical protein